MPFIGTCASTTVHVTRLGTDADIGLSLKSSTETVISSVYQDNLKKKSVKQIVKIMKTRYWFMNQDLLNMEESRQIDVWAHLIGQKF